MNGFPIYADYILRKVESIVRSTSVINNVRRKVIKFDEIKRSHFSFVEDYINAYQTQYNQLSIYKVEPYLFGALFIILRQLEGELKSVTFTYETLKDKILDSVTKEVFSDIYKALTIKARDIPTSLSFDPEASTNVARNNNQRGGGARGRGYSGRGCRGSLYNSRSDNNNNKDN